MRTFFLTVFALSLLIFASCASKPSILTFYVDSGSQQYFVQPSEMLGPGCKVMIDFTYRTTNDFVVCNYTISVKEGVSRNYSDVRFIIDGGQTVPMGETETLITNKSLNEIRLSSRLPIEKFRDVISSSHTSLDFTMNGKVYSALGGKYFIKQMEAAKLELADDD